MTKGVKAEKVQREYGRGTGKPDPTDIHVGNRIRMRRLLLGMNQETLAEALGLTFQQVQKYEGGANRVSASRLSHMAQILDVPIQFFFDGMVATGKETPAQAALREHMAKPATLELIRLYLGMPDAIRASYLGMVMAVAAGGPVS